MAKELIRVLIGVGTVVGRAFTKAVRREILESQNAARARASAAGGSRTEQHKSAATDALTGMTLQEAKQILNIEDISDKENLQKSYEHLFSHNEKSKGGSFYIQSKVVRAKERIDHELGDQGSDASQETSQDPSDKT